MREFLQTWGPRAGLFLLFNVAASVLITVLIERGIAQHMLAQQQCQKTCDGYCFENADTGVYECPKK